MHSRFYQNDDSCPTCGDRGYKWVATPSGGADRAPCHCPAGYSFADPLRPAANQPPRVVKDPA